MIFVLATDLGIRDVGDLTASPADHRCGDLCVFLSAHCNTVRNASFDRVGNTNDRWGMRPQDGVFFVDGLSFDVVHRHRRFGDLVRRVVQRQEGDIGFRHVPNKVPTC